MMSGIEKPSTPRKYSTRNISIHGTRSTNCIAAVLVSKPVASGTLTTNVTMETASASQRSMRFSPSPTASTARPPRMGSQINVLSNPTPGQPLTRNQPIITDKPITIAKA